MPKLTNATVQRRANDVSLSWELDGDLTDPALNSWLLSAHLIGGDDGPIHEFGFRHRDGKLDDVYVFDHVGVRNQYLQVVHRATG